MAVKRTTYRSIGPAIVVPKCAPYDWKVGLETFAKLSGGRRLDVVDLGCGDGQRSSLFLPHVRSLVGVDLSRTSVQKARARGITSIVGDVQNLPLRTSAFDAVMSFHVIEHLRDFDAFIEESHRVLKQGGFMLMVTPNRKRLSMVLYKSLKNIDEYQYPMNKDHTSEFTEEEIYELLQRSIFERFNVQPIGFGVPIPLPCRHITLTLKRAPKPLRRYAQQYVFWAWK